MGVYAQYDIIIMLADEVKTIYNSHHTSPFGVGVGSRFDLLVNIPACGNHTVTNNRQGKRQMSEIDIIRNNQHRVEHSKPSTTVSPESQQSTIQ